MKRSLLWFTIATDIVKGAVLLAVVLVLLPQLGITLPLWGVILLALALVVQSVVSYRLSHQALAKKPVVAPGNIIGSHGKAVTVLTPEGYVQVQGELWQAQTACQLEPGEEVIVTGMNLLKLLVTPKHP